MVFQYSCFLSYQRGNDLLDSFARELFQALTGELALRTPLPVYFDTARLESGDSWTRVIEQALRSSVCLVPVLTPTYFSQERPYCSREYLGMQQIEQRRMTTSGILDGLIFGVVLRGGDRLPSAIRRRQCFDFSDYLAFGGRQFRSRGFVQKVSAMADLIAQRCNSYLSAAASSELDTAVFTLPSAEEAVQWLATLPEERAPSGQ